MRKFIMIFVIYLAAGALGPLAARAQEKAAAGDVAPLAAAYNAAGGALFDRIKAKPGNIVLSPYSIGAAMAMVRAGASGETDKELAAVLRHAGPKEAINEANAALHGVLQGYAASGSAKLAAANALMLTADGAIISQDYRALIKDKYSSEILEAAGLQKINDWVAQKTEGKIVRILDALPKSTAAVLLNAVYFKAPWESPFPREATRNDTFHLTSRSATPAPTMHQKAPFRVYKGEGYRAIELPYAEPTLGLIVVLPDAVDGANAVSGLFDAGAASMLATELKNASPAEVDLALPRFKASFQASLVSPFKQAGLKLAFNKDADFGGMTGAAIERRIYLGDIVHRAVIEVGEEGTEASASSGAVVRQRGFNLKEAEPERFVVDHPFLFYLIEKKSGAILFQGRISDPTKQ